MHCFGKAGPFERPRIGRGVAACLVVDLGARPRPQAMVRLALTRHATPLPPLPHRAFPKSAGLRTFPRSRRLRLWRKDKALPGRLHGLCTSGVPSPGAAAVQLPLNMMDITRRWKSPASSHGLLVTSHALCYNDSGRIQSTNWSIDNHRGIAYPGRKHRVPHGALQEAKSSENLCAA